MSQPSQFNPQTIDLSAGFVQLIRTALSNPKVTFDKTGLKSYDASGSLLVAINADGTAQFVGIVTADGLDINAGTNTTGADTNRIRWLSQADGSVVADLYGFESAGARELDISSHVAATDVNRNAVTRLSAANANTGVTAQLLLEAGNPTTGAKLAQVTVGAGSIVLVRSDQTSDLLQAANNLADVASVVTARRNIGVAVGAQVINFPNANRATSVSVNHGLGRVPIAVLFGVNDTGVGGLVVQPGFSSLAANTFTLGANSNTVINGNQTIHWGVIA